MRFLLLAFIACFCQNTWAQSRIGFGFGYQYTQAAGFNTMIEARNMAQAALYNAKQPNLQHGAGAQIHYSRFLGNKLRISPEIVGNMSVSRTNTNGKTFGITLVNAGLRLQAAYYPFKKAPDVVGKEGLYISVAPTLGWFTASVRNNKKAVMVDGKTFSASAQSLGLSLGLGYDMQSGSTIFTPFVQASYFGTVTLKQLSLAIQDGTNALTLSDQSSILQIQAGIKLSLGKEIVNNPTHKPRPQNKALHKRRPQKR